ncbi:hypothetical protein HII36_19765 [Nonomuraea sp. NN258]|uniref:hypothetical protein n=1 Tax=Nonomuraea antri TaxID=2730852 RepID=UPI00156A35EF|nr:hypothetical protein [Nonomuraea antri]NRQ34072.1 hypothetical protein [Nonomuraea antri]
MRKPSRSARRFAFALIAGAALLSTGGAAFAGPDPADPAALELRVVVDDCPAKTVEP